MHVEQGEEEEEEEEREQEEWAAASLAVKRPRAVGYRGKQPSESALGIRRARTMGLGFVPFLALPRKCCHLLVYCLTEQSVPCHND